MPGLRHHPRLAIAVAVVATGCAPDDAPLTITSVSPPYGLLVGGSSITITGSAKPFGN